MKVTSTSPDTHPLVVAYLQDLDRVLQHADPQERDDTCASIREHITDALRGPSTPTTAQVQQVLHDLGPVERIAAATTPAAARSTSENLAGRDWLGPGLLTASVLAFLLIIVNPFLSATACLAVVVAAVIVLRRKATSRRTLVTIAAVVAASGLLLAIAALLFLTAASTGTQVGDVIPAD